MLRRLRSNSKVTDHYNGKFFFNPWVTEKRESFIEYLRWKLFRNPGLWPSRIKVIPRKPTALRPDEKIRVTFINHSTLLIQVPGMNILTDPVWSERVGPWSWFGVKRAKDPGVKLADLPYIDAVVISHNHYDHLDAPTVRMLEEKFSPQFIVAQGDGIVMEELGCKRIQEMDWWQEFRLSDEYSVTATPAQHWSQRWLNDINQSLWMGWVLQRGCVDGQAQEPRENLLYFAGDTGLGPHFKEIASRFPDLTMACLPVGSYAPRAVTRMHHLNPEDAAFAFQVLGARFFIPIHHGAFPLADESYSEPKIRLYELWREQSLNSAALKWLTEGQHTSVGELPPLSVQPQPLQSSLPAQPESPETRRPLGPDSTTP